MCVHPWWTYLLFPAFLARFSWKQSEQIIVFILEVIAPWHSALLPWLCIRRCRWEFRMKKKVEILLDICFLPPTRQQQLRRSLKTFNSVLSGSLMMMMRMKTGEQGVCLFWCPICERVGSGPLLAPRSEDLPSVLLAARTQSRPFN